MKRKFKKIKKFIKAIFRYIVAFSAGLKQTAEAVNRLENVDELDESICKITGF